MADKIRIESLVPNPWPDGRRVALLLRVSGLPPYGLRSGSLSFDAPGGSSFEDGIGSVKLPEDHRRPNVELIAETSQSDREAGELGSAPDSARLPSPYPDVTLSILDAYGNEVATTYIVEHKEPELEFTLHVTGAEHGPKYVARAVMSTNDEIIHMVEVPFEFDPSAAEDSKL